MLKCNLKKLKKNLWKYWGKAKKNDTTKKRQLVYNPLAYQFKADCALVGFFGFGGNDVGGSRGGEARTELVLQVADGVLQHSDAGDELVLHRLVLPREVRDDVEPLLLRLRDKYK